MELSLRKKLSVIFAVVFIDFLGLSFILPLYPELSEKFGLSATLITLLTASYALMQFLFSPILGRLSDRFGRKPILILSSLGTASSFIFFGLASSVWMLFASRILNGIFGSSAAVAQAYISDVTEKSERAKGMGVMGAALGLGLILGPTLSAALGGYGFRGPAFGAAGICVLNLFFISFFLKESLKKELRKKSSGEKIIRFKISGFLEILKHPLMGKLVSAYFISMFGLAAIQNIAVLFTAKRFHLSLQENGYMFAGIGLFLIFAQGFLVGRMERKIGEFFTMIIGTILFIFGCFITPAIENISIIIVGAGFIAVGAGLYIPSVNSLVSKNSLEDERGEVFGLVQGLIGLALIFGPIFGGILFDTFGSGSPFFAAGILSIISLLISFRSFKKIRSMEKSRFIHR
jgi:DHA1 family tetracycline resistance protein-like MFS transporter